MYSRCCARCRRALTDPASRDCGVGPVCRGLDNAALAQIMPANASLAVQAFGAIDVADFPPDALDEIAAVAQAIAHMGAGDDMRPTVRKIEWLASLVPAHCASRHAMHDTLCALGYLTLAAMWAGDVSTGKASVSCEGGRLYLQGPRNKGGRIAFKRIRGAQFHPADGTNGARWSAPASQADAFRRCILTHWPLASGIEAAVTAAKSEPVQAEIPATKPAPTVTIKPCLHGFEIRSPYSPKFLEELKSLVPWNARKWDAAHKCWVVTGDYIEKAREAAEKAYGVGAIAA